MNGCFRINTISLAVALAFPALAFAAEPYPALPPTLSTAVTPNIMLFIDTSGSMLQDSNNAWMQTGLCNSNVTAWNSCVDNNTNGYRTAVDSEATTPDSKMNIAKRVARNVVNANSSLRFGLFTFHDNPNNIGGSERGESSVKRVDIKDMSVAANKTALFNALNTMNGRTSTPLAEGLLEITRYFEGKTSLYSGVNGNGTYTSPIQYRCQKNFALIITDGDATDDDNLPGSGKVALPYTGRDANGGAVSKNFSVCTASNAVAADGNTVTCPATYDGTATNRTFGGAGNRDSAIRDVAMYANVADLRVGGTDSDGKSFDDPKFAKQNLTTYTIGFAVNNPVLPATATVGGGKYYTANNEASLSASLSDAVASIVASISNAGGVAAQSETTTVGNKVFQPVFNPNGWYGELRCYDLDSNGNLITGGCTNPKGVIPAVASRKLFSSKVLPAQATPTVAFDFNNAANPTNADTTLAAMTTQQKALLGADATAQKKTIRFLRGEEGIAGFRTRPNGLLGDIIDGQPAVVSVPAGITTDPDYATFIANNSSRGIVLIGANDGMLHAFKIANMSELMGYIPSSVYPHLKALTATDYGQPAGTPHTFHVNGTLRQQDVKLGSNWKTIVASGLGQGGQGFLAVDATNESAMTSLSAVKWEWNDQNDAEMGYSFAAPVIYNVRTSASTVVPAVILANGYNNSYDDTAVGGQKTAADSSALYIVNADTGALIKKISVASGAGLSSPAGVDFGQDGILDYVYAGDMNGKMWRFDLTSSDPSGFFVHSAPLFDAGPTHPIVMRPAIKPVSKSDGTPLGNLILFGTGKLLTDADRLDATTQSFYAVLDDMTTTQGTVPRADLQDRTIVDEASIDTGDSSLRTGTYRKISTSPSLDLTSTATGTKKGWYLDFPATTERLVTSPMLFDDKLLFGTGITQSTEKCLPGGKGWVMGVDPMTGSVTKSSRGKEFSFIDVKLDGKSTDADKVGFSTGSAFVSGFSKDGIPTELTYVAASSKIVTTTSSEGSFGDAGQVIALKEANMMAVYTGNAASGVSSGNAMGRPASTGAGKLYSGTIGDDKVEKETMLGTSFGVKVETSTWREIK